MNNAPSDNSGFILPPDENTSAQFTDYAEIPSRGFNVIYKAKRYGKWHILKGLKPQLRDNETYRDLLRKEFDLCVGLDHPNIVGAMTLEDNPVVGKCIVMAYVDAVALDEFLHTSPSAECVRKIVDEMLAALHYLHSKQIVHRDLKPSNILVTRNGNNVKIIDFGLADAADYAQLKQPAGTLVYAAPEQLKEGAPIDCRTDLYAFGKLLEYHFPRRYRAVAQRCTQNLPDRRPANAATVKKMLAQADRKPRRIALLCIGCILVGIVVAFWAFPPNPESERTKPHPTSVKEIVTIPSQNTDSQMGTAELRSREATDNSAAMKEELETRLERFYQPFFRELQRSHYATDIVPRKLTYNMSVRAKNEIFQPMLEKIPEKSDFYTTFYNYYLVLQQQYNEKGFNLCKKFSSSHDLIFELMNQKSEGKITQQQFQKKFDSLQLNEVNAWQMDTKTGLWVRGK